MSNEIGQEARLRIARSAAERMRREIEETGGREVFFAGSLNARGLVEDVRVCARGNDAAVPAFFEMLDLRDVVIHNHPSGGIEPSDADLDVASICGHNGHGVYIVDNEVTRVYVVVEPFLEKDRHKLDPAQMAKVFRPNSRMARLLPQFEIRPQQSEMMEVVSRAFNHDGIAVVEAPTGIGKTVAYLIPAVKWAVANRERVVISTRTINLQEQIVFKDVPLLQKCLDERFTAVLVKGRSNYVCRRKLERTLSEATLFDDEETQDALKALAEWAKKTKDGSRSDLPFLPKRELWERICSEADTCLGTRCPLAKECFVTKARREVAKADLIIANHHILFSDIAIKKETGDFTALAVLPAYKRVIFDEAHSIEDSATEYLGVNATRNRALALIGRFVRKERGQERGLVPFVQAKLVKGAPQLNARDLEKVQDLIDNHLLPSLAAAREGIIAAFGALRSLSAEKCDQIGRDIKWRLTEEALADPAVREVHSVYVLPAVADLRDCAKHCAALLEWLKRIRPSADEAEPPFLTEIVQLQGYQGRLESLANVLAEGTSEELAPNTVRWIEIDSSKPSFVQIKRCPLNVGEPLAQWVYGNLKTVAMTSATLSVQRSFDYLFSRIGLNLVEPGRIEAVSLDSPFNFQKQAVLCIARDIAAPNDRAFLDECAGAVREILAVTRGHTLVLFTSFYALDHVHRELESELKNAGITPLKHGEATRTQLLDRFRADVSSVLFATDSFWEGIDVVGDALQCVILTKLPFRVPTEPIIQARAEAIELAGGNSFAEYAVPQAVVKFRQGFGRLIRRKTDRGAIVVLDRRIVTKYYGSVFLKSLPGVPVVSGPRNVVRETLEEFFPGRETP